MFFLKELRTSLSEGLVDVDWVSFLGGVVVISTCPIPVAHKFYNDIPWSVLGAEFTNSVGTGYIFDCNFFFIFFQDQVVDYIHDQHISAAIRLFRDIGPSVLTGEN